MCPQVLFRRLVLNFSVKSLADFRLSIVGHAMWGHNSPSCDMFQCYIAAKISFLAAHTPFSSMFMFKTQISLRAGWKMLALNLASIASLTVLLTDSMDLRTDFTDVTLVREDTHWRLYWCDPGLYSKSSPFLIHIDCRKFTLYWEISCYCC